MGYRNYPDDLRRSAAAGGVPHVLGRFVEISVPLLVLLSPHPVTILLGVAVAFHFFIVSTFPLAAPTE
ncbi:DUF3556 domain-containing protein [Nocardia sp. NBC_00881]|uniref:DUF3556 domain-containing protein n=1 Tax=Nocardia sp. NBC_00881 TaxID=2975995 RepID=UPI003862E87F|nr:DUF3556 domain-containing protein [Nocardia sp. NBC_00881]